MFYVSIKRKRESSTTCELCLFIKQIELPNDCTIIIREGKLSVSVGQEVHEGSS